MTQEQIQQVCVWGGGGGGGGSVFTRIHKPEGTILSHDHTPHLECSDCQYQTFAACVLLSTKHFSSVQCSLSSIFRAQTVFKFK